MYPIDFEGSNKLFEREKDDVEDQYTSLPAHQGYVKGDPFLISLWKPNKEDLEALNKGLPLILLVPGEVMPFVEIYTVDYNKKLNF